MGAGNTNIEKINEEVLNPPIIDQVENTRIKTKLFPEGEIYYLRNHDQIKENAVPTANAKGLLSYDNIVVLLTISYEFKKPNLGEEFIGSRIKLYHSDLIKDNQFVYIGATEIFENKEMTFKKKFQMFFCFQKIQEVKAEIELPDNIQVVNTTLGKIVGTKTMSIELPFFYKGNTEFQSIIIKGYVLKDETKNSFVTLNLYTDLSILPYSDYFVVISNWNNGETAQKVWKSKEHQGKQFHFQAQMITLQDLCLGEKDRKITIEFYGVYSGKIGHVDTNLGELNKAMENKTQIDIIGEGQTTMGYFYIEYNIEKISRFIDLVENGLQIHLSIAIDYTQSNLDPKNPRSLHYVSDINKPSQYELVMRAISEIVLCYDFFGDIILLGFGGVVPPLGETSHCFPVTLTKQEKLNGINKCVDEYKKSLNEVKLDGPTYFTPILRENLQIIKDTETPTSIYTIILILTDGTIHDFDDTKKLMIRNSPQPFSVIMVGIGNEDFSDMYTFDGDRQWLEDKNGNKCDRDICMFIKNNDYKGKATKLAERVLMVIPSQIEQYYRLNRHNFKGIYDIQKNRKFSKLPSGFIGNIVNKMAHRRSSVGKIKSQRKKTDGEKNEEKDGNLIKEEEDSKEYESEK
jgi:hypothetical protein